MKIQINPKQIFMRLLVLTTAVYALSPISKLLELYAGQTYGLFFFDVDYPKNIPAVYYVVLTAVGMMLALFVANAVKAKRGEWLAWLGVAFVALMMAIDKGTSLSTTFSRAQITEIFHLNEFKFYPVYAIVGLAGAAFAWWLGRQLPPNTFRLLLGWLGVKAFGLIVLYLVSGYYAHWATTEDFMYTFLSTLEEAVETISTLILFYAILDYMTAYLPKIQLEFVSSTEAVEQDWRLGTGD